MQTFSKCHSDWQIEYQQQPTRCLRLWRGSGSGNGSLLRCWHDDQAMTMLHTPEMRQMFSLRTLAEGHRLRLSKDQVKQVLLIAAMCAINHHRRPDRPNFNIIH